MRARTPQAASNGRRLLRRPDGDVSAAIRVGIVPIIRGIHGLSGCRTRLYWPRPRSTSPSRATNRPIVVRQRRRPARLAHGDEHLQKAAAQRQKSPCLAEICEPPTLGRVARRWNGSCSAQRACGDGQVCWQALFWLRPQSQTVAAHPQPPPPQPVQTQLNVQCHWPPRRMSTRAAGQPGCRSPRNRNAGGMYRAQ